MDNERPTPEEMLARLRALPSEDEGRGKLHVFFGAAPGVGKTYTMLEAARAKKREGVDVVVGWVETHGRAETEALLEGLEILPPQILPYRHLQLKEFDLDAALARRPALVVVDELAHTNVSGARHAKRWQDVEELLGQGVDVYTTLNVQHIESLNDVVVQITGVVVREKIPDSVFDAADEIELVDLPPEELIQRLREGKVYVPDMAAQAIESFFQVGNLIALRELAMRRAAERVHAQIGKYRQREGVKRAWPTAESVIVAVSPAPTSANLVRAAYRTASKLRAPWAAVFVETPKFVHLSPAVRQCLNDHLKLAEELGAETIVTAGEDVAEEILAVAQKRNATRILVGKSRRPRWHMLFRPAVADRIISRSEHVAVTVTGGEAAPPERAAPAPPAGRRRWKEYAMALAAVAAASGLCYLTLPIFDLADLAMIYLFGIVLVSSRLGRGPSLFAAALSVAALDFLFVPPYLTFDVADARRFITFGVMLVVGLLVSTLTLRIKQQAAWARERERRASSLYAMARDFVTLPGVEGIVRASEQHVHDYLGVAAKTILRPVLETPPGRAGAEESFFGSNASRERAVATWVMNHGREAGHTTATLSAAEALYIPLKGTCSVVGVLAVKTPSLDRALAPAEKEQLYAFAHQTALALERALLAGGADLGVPA
jgi:two-component system sensor histidine kinase KdpD